MSTQSNAVSETPITSQAAAPALISPGRRFYWSVRREVWENRWIYLAPAAAAGFVILGVLIGLAHGALNFNVVVTTPSGTHEHSVELFGPAMAAIMGVAFVVAIFYCLGTLHGERRDRSILFWKSLPVSDLTTVLAKAAIPFVVLPAVTMALIVVTHAVMLMIQYITLATGGRAMVWPNPGLPQTWGMTLYHLVAIHVLWYAPIYCYLLMVSAWAKRAPFLWAVLPPVAAGIVERIAFGSSHVFLFLGDRLSGESSGAVTGAGGMTPELMQQITPLTFLASPGLWIGLAFAALFLVAAVRLRRSQSVI
jgi:ABC-2 type transport system permease protein